MNRRGALAGAALAVLAAAGARADLIGHGGPVRGLAVSEDGTRILSAGFDYSVMLWDPASQRALARLIGHEAGVNAVAFLPGGRAVSASDDGTVGVWDLRRLRLERRLAGHAGKVNAVAASPDGRWAASAGWDRTVRLWDLEANREVRRLAGHRANVNAVAISADGGRLASGAYDGAVLIWDAATGAKLVEIRDHDFAVNALAFLPDDRSVVTASTDKTVRRFDAGTGRAEGLLQMHAAPVNALALGPGIGASASADGDIRIWRTPDGSSLRRIVSRKAAWALAFSGDGRRLYAALSDGRIAVWDVATGQPVGAMAEAQAESHSTADTSRGARLFRTCEACHSLTADGAGRAGPSLYGLFGRPAGSVPDYPYSDGLSNSRVVWSEATVDALFAQGPERFTPGSKMPLQRMLDPRDRADLIAYLKRVTAPKPRRHRRRRGANTKAR